MNLLATLYISIEEARELLGAPKRRNKFLYEDGLESANLMLKPIGADKTEVYYISGESDFVDMKVHFVNAYGEEMKPVIDMALVARLDALLKHSPRSKFLNSLKSQALLGEDIHPNALEVVEEIEEKVANPDVAMLDRLRKITEIIGQDNFVDSLEAQLKAGRTLSPKQVAVVEKLEASVKGMNTNLSRIQKLLSMKPMDRFLQSLEKQVLGGRSLSPKQQDALNMIESKMKASAPAVSSAPKAPVVISKRTKQGKRYALVEDLLGQRAMSITDVDFLIKLKKKIASKSAISIDELKKVRHLCYRYERRLTGKYPADFKAYVQAVFN